MENEGKSTTKPKKIKKKAKGRKSNLYVLGSTALSLGVALVLPEIINRISSYIYEYMYSNKKY